MLINDPTSNKIRSFPHSEIAGPCFVATITSLTTGDKNRAALLECVFTLRHYLLAARDVEIKKIHMMCPPPITGKSHWVLEELITITLIDEVGTHKGGAIYQTSESVYKIGDFDHLNSTQGQVIYSAQNLLSHAPKPAKIHSERDALRLIGPMD